MALILLSGGDLPVLARWSDSAHAAAHDVQIVPPVSIVQRIGESAAACCVVDLGRKDGADLTRLLDAVASCPQTYFIALTARPNAAQGLELLRAGVRGYCNRLAARGAVDAVLAAVLSDEIWAGRQVTDHLLAAALTDDVADPIVEVDVLNGLTERESQIALKVGAGDSNKVIAADLGISEPTVKAHLNRVFRKTGIRSRVQLALAIAQAESHSRRRSSA